MTAAASLVRPDGPAGSAVLTRLRETAMGLVMPRSERDATRRDAIAAFAVRVMGAGLLYLSQIALARFMGGYEYGIYVFVWAWVLILGGLSDIGLNVALIRLFSQYRERGEIASLRGLVRGSQILSLVSGTCVALLGLLGLWAFEPYVASHYVLPAYLALICVPIYALTEVQDGIGRGAAWMGIALLPPYVLRPLLLLLTMLAAHSAGLPMEAKTAAAAAIVATWTSGIIQAAMLRRRLHAEIGAGERRYDFAMWIPTSMPLLAISASELVIQNADLLIVSHTMTPTDAGIYFAAAKTMSLIMFVHYAVGSAVANRFAALHARGDSAGLAVFVKDAVRWTFWPSLGAAAGILALGLPLLWLFGPQFESGYSVMLILVVGFLLRSAVGPAEFLLNMLGEQKRCALVLVTAAVLNVTLNFTLVPMFGLNGAATATAISLVSAAVMNYFLVRARLGIDLAIWRSARP